MLRSAVATPPDPDSPAVPSTVPPTEKETVPAGEFVPEAAVTVAVITVLVFAEILLGAADAVVLVVIELEPFQRVTRLYTSADPKPVV
jgi:hypothetical protein